MSGCFAVPVVTCANHMAAMVLPYELHRVLISVSACPRRRPGESHSPRLLLDSTRCAQGGSWRTHVSCTSSESNGAHVTQPVLVTAWSGKSRIVPHLLAFTRLDPSPSNGGACRAPHPAPCTSRSFQTNSTRSPRQLRQKQIHHDGFLLAWRSSCCHLAEWLRGPSKSHLKLLPAPFSRRRCKTPWCIQHLKLINSTRPRLMKGVHLIVSRPKDEHLTLGNLALAVSGARNGPLHVHQREHANCAEVGMALARHPSSSRTATQSLQVPFGFCFDCLSSACTSACISDSDEAQRPPLTFLTPRRAETAVLFQTRRQAA